MCPPIAESRDPTNYTSNVHGKTLDKTNAQLPNGDATRSATIVSARRMEGKTIGQTRRIGKFQITFTIQKPKIIIGPCHSID